MRLFLMLSVWMFFVAALSANAAIQSVSWGEEASGTRSYIHGNIYMDTSKNQKNLEFGHAAGDRIEDALAKYYLLARKNDVSNIVNLFTAVDGSKERLQSQLERIPDLYREFYKVDKIVLGDIFVWGDYYQVSVDWYSQGKKMVAWSELLYCKAECFLSNKLMSPTAEFKIVNATIYSFKRHASFVKSLPPAVGAEVVTIESPYGSKNYPISYEYKINTYPSLPKFDKSFIPDFSKYHSDVQLVSKFIYGVWSKTEDLVMRGNADKLNSIVAAFWSEYDPHDSIKVFENTNSDIDVFYMSPISLVQSIYNWKYFEVLGYLDVANDSYVILRIENGVGKRNIQLFALTRDTAGKPLLSAKPKNSQDFYSILMSPEFGRALKRKYLD